MTKPPELLPCPFCGPMNGHYGFTISRFGTRLTCFCCDSHGPPATTREEAIAAWNTRADLAKAQAGALLRQASEACTSVIKNIDTLKAELADQRVKALVELLREARADLVSYVETDWPEDQRAQYPSYQRKWERDMELCNRIDAALRAIGGEA